MDNEKFGKFIKELRTKNHMTQKELAEKINITDKAISKWERGLSFPDISMLNILAETFDVNVSEILNAEYGKKEEVDIEKIVAERIKEIDAKKEKRDEKRKKIKKIIGIVSFIIFLVCSIMQLGFLTVLKRYQFEYVLDFIFYIVNGIILITAGVSILFLFDLRRYHKENLKNILTISIVILLVIVNFIFALANIKNKKSIIRFSNNLSNELVLKQDLETGKVTVYKNIKLLIFARPKETLEDEVKGDLKLQWLTPDICSVTYTDRDGNLKEYVATYGDRGNGISYYYVFHTLIGDWQTMDQSGSITKVNCNHKEIIVTKNGVRECFEYSDCRQFGTIAIVLYKGEVPKYVIALNMNCILDEATDIIKKGGTITLCEVSMKKTMAEELQCTTYKSEELEGYNIVSLQENEYCIKDGNLYIRYDGTDIIEVPDKISTNTSLYTDYNYQISPFKTVFINTNEDQKYILYSDDKGYTWQRTYIDKSSYIQNIHFISKEIGFMLEFEDRAMGDAYGKISKTIDGGKTWNIVSNGIGEGKDKSFKTSSQILFINEKIGFLTMPHTGGQYCDLYITKNGGIQFEPCIIEENNIYDYYELPTLKENLLTLEISQGSDGDYHGGDSKIYISQDSGYTWKLKNN